VSTEAAVDPIDALDLSDTNEVETDVTMPPEMVMGETPEPVADEEQAAEVATEAAERPALPEGYKYDSVGRVRDAKTGHVVAKDKVAEIVAQGQAPVGKPEPFQYRVKGETKAAEGFLQNPDGSIVVSAEKAGELRYLLNAKEMLGQESEFVNTVKAENAALKQELQRSKAGENEETTRAKALVDAYARMLEEPDEAKAIEAFFRLRTEYPVLLAKAEANYWKSRGGAKAPARSDAPETPQGLPAREDAIEATTDHIEHLKLDFKFRDLSADDWKQFVDRSARTPFAYIRPATAADAKAHDVTVGQPVFDTDALAQDIELHAASVRAARETATRQAKVAADNARKTQPSIDAPPVPGSSAPPAKGQRAFKNEQDIDTWFDSDEL
jgi:hypothetical protein